MSKGSFPRPIPNRKQYEENWDKIFNKPKEPSTPSVPNDTAPKNE